ncbi:MAG: tRNA (adenosine(37)-N6)-dimethylallyltransferase MiaA [Paramuribaculum sp.]|nr:tRNA (adenosine(37)-N6)-dimethylallyltransferase MiaA [Paramuribaculum sp.]
MSRLLLVITGPTASGKSALALDLAEKIGCDIISADSRQIYRDIPIVTAAPTADDLSRVCHHFVGVASLDEPYSAARYEQEVLALLPAMWRKSEVAILCGGSMMYIDAVINGLDRLPDVPDATRARVVEFFHTHGLDALQQWLHDVDPDYYGRVDLNNHGRLIHAIEVSLEAGVPYSSLLGKEKQARDFDVLMVAPEWPREMLFDRINSRVGRMVADGLEDEARRVYPLRSLNSLNTVGLKEMFAYFDGLMDRNTAIARIAKNTRVYAKKQLTWMRRYTDLVRLDARCDMVEPTLRLLQARRP